VDWPAPPAAPTLLPVPFALLLSVTAARMLKQSRERADLEETSVAFSAAGIQTAVDNTCVDNKDDRPPLCAILRAVSELRFRNIGTPVQLQNLPGMQTATCAGTAAPARSLASSVRPLIRSVRVFVRFFLHSFARSLVRSCSRSYARSHVGSRGRCDSTCEDEMAAEPPAQKRKYTRMLLPEEFVDVVTRW
jgi:hypothetical protein